MMTTATPEGWMALRIPKSYSASDRVVNGFLGHKSVALERQRAQVFPPPLDQVRMGRYLVREVLS
jgi:hypothetical protein